MGRENSITGSTTLERPPPPAATEGSGSAVGQPESAAVVEARRVAREALRIVPKNGPEAALEGIAGAEPPPVEKGPTDLTQQPENGNPEDRLAAIFERMTPGQLQRRADSLNRTLVALNRKFDRVGSLQDMENLQDQMNGVQDQLDIIEGIQEQRGDEISGTTGGTGREGGTKRQTREEESAERDEARIEARERQEEYRRLARLSADELNTEAQTEEAVLRATRRELEGSRSGADREEINKRIRDSEARLEAINNLRESRAPEELKKGAEAEEAEARRQEEERTRWIIKSASVGQLEGWINQSNQQLTALEYRINQLRDPAIYGRDKEAAQNELKKKVAESNELRRRLTTYQEATERAREAEAVERGFEQVPGIESIRKMSANEFRGLSVEDQAKYLAELGEFTNMPDDIQFASLKEIAKNSGAMSIEQRATFAKRLGQELLEKG